MSTLIHFFDSRNGELIGPIGRDEPHFLLWVKFTEDLYQDIRNSVETAWLDPSKIKQVTDRFQEYKDHTIYSGRFAEMIEKLEPIIPLVTQAGVAAAVVAVKGVDSRSGFRM